MIDKNIQLPLLTYSILMATVAIVLTAACSLVYASMLETDQPKWITLTIFLLTGIFAFAVMIFVGLFLTNRVAGPLYRLRLHMSDLANGEIREPLASREGDYTHEIFEEYNRLVRKIQAIDQKNS